MAVQKMRSAAAGFDVKFKLGDGGRHAIEVISEHSFDAFAIDQIK
jgi:hypothetical protein